MQKASGILDDVYGLIATVKLQKLIDNIFSNLFPYICPLTNKKNNSTKLFKNVSPIQALNFIISSKTSDVGLKN
jgi:hypothetical protein